MHVIRTPDKLLTYRARHRLVQFPVAMSFVQEARLNCVQQLEWPLTFGVQEQPHNALMLMLPVHTPLQLQMQMVVQTPAHKLSQQVRQEHAA